MTIVKKLAALVALTAAAAPAFALDPDLTAYADAATAYTAMTAEFSAAPTTTVDGNFALIVQQASTNNAYIDQTGGNNLAAIIQASDVNTGLIYQVGDQNRAMIYQH